MKGMRIRTEKTAREFGVTEIIRKIENELMTHDGIFEVDFDLDGLYDNLNQVIILVGYKVPFETYFEDRAKVLQYTVKIAKENGLKRTCDSVEDYGQHLYFVFSCKEWNLPKLG